MDPPIVDDLDSAAASTGWRQRSCWPSHSSARSSSSFSLRAGADPYYSAIISCTVTQSERDAAAAGTDAAARVGRRRLLINLASFVAGFTLLYAASGATVGLIGEGVRKPLGEYGRLIQLVGGSLILFFALRILGVGEQLRRLAGRLPRFGDRRGEREARERATFSGRAATALRRVAAARAAARRRGERHARDRFLPRGYRPLDFVPHLHGRRGALSAAVYAGITSWYSGLITLALYSLGIAVPMVCISLGFFQIRLSLAQRLEFNRALRTASGVILAGIALLVLSGRERVVTDLTFRFLGGVFRWFA